MRVLFAAVAGAFLLASAATSAQAKLNVFACVPEWAALTNTMGGDRVDVDLATTALEDPEKLPPTPGMFRSMGAADLFVCTGLDLEGTWLPAVLERANNPKVANGQPGQFYSSQFVPILKDDLGAFHTSHTHAHHRASGQIDIRRHNIIRPAPQLPQPLI